MKTQKFWRILLIWLIFLILGIAIGKINKAQIHPSTYKIINKQSKEFSLDPKLVKAIILTESGGKNTARSYKGALGLMQLMPSTAKYLGKQLKLKINNQELIKQEINIKLGCYYLHILIRRFQGDLVAALAAYNTGPTRVKRWLNKYSTYSTSEIINAKASKETRLFVKNVLRRYK